MGSTKPHTHHVSEALHPRIIRHNTYRHLLDVREFIFPENPEGYPVWRRAYLGLVLPVPKHSTGSSWGVWLRAEVLPLSCDVLCRAWEQTVHRQDAIFSSRSQGRRVHPTLALHGVTLAACLSASCLGNEGLAHSRDLELTGRRLPSFSSCLLCDCSLLCFSFFVL